MNTQSDDCFRERLGNLVAKLSKGIEGDPRPATTRTLLAYLRTLQTCGPEELYESIMNSLYASVAALRVDQGSTTAAVGAMLLMFEKCADDYLGSETKGPPR